MPRGVYPRKTDKKKGAPAKASKTLKETQDFDPRAVPETVKLDELSMLRLAKANAEARAASSEVLVKKGVKEGILNKVDPHGVLKKLDNEIQFLTARFHEAQQELMEVKKEIEGRMGIDLTKYAYDDKTGVLHDISSQTPPPDVGQVPGQEPLPTQKAAPVQ